MTVAAFGVIAALLLSGCGASDPGAATPSPTPSTSTATPSSAPKTPTPSPTPTQPKLKTVSFECHWQQPSTQIGLPAEYKTATYTDVHDAWAAGIAFSGCEAKLSTSGDYSTEELAAVTAAYPTDPLPEKVKYLWGMCAETANHYQVTGPINENQRMEGSGAVILCPDHPAANVMANGSPEQQERAAGLRFGSGVFEVGTRIQPGTYRATGTIQNCYWERLDSAGETIDNNFVSAATQVEVTVQPTDFSVHFTSCGEFVKVG